MLVTRIPPEPVRSGYSGKRGGHYIEFNDGTVKLYKDAFDREAALQRAYRKVNLAIMREYNSRR